MFVDTLMRSGLLGFLVIVSNCAEILMTATLTELAYEQKGSALHTVFQGQVTSFQTANSL